MTARYAQALCLIAATVSAPVETTAQQVFIDLTDGTTLSFPVEQVRTKLVDASQLQLFLWDGSSQSWDLAEIRRYRFQDISTGLTEAATTARELQVYPNPSTGEVTIALPAGGAWTLEVLDPRGALVYRQRQVFLADGAAAMHWPGKDTQGRDVAAGAYLCRAMSMDLILTSTVVIER
jgi:hypothetical protein